jgi:hypothetical protein
MIRKSNTVDAQCPRTYVLRRVVAAGLSALVSSGCATVFSGTHQIFLLRSDRPNTAFSVNGRDLGTGVVTVPVAKRAMGRTVFGATAPGCAPVSSRIDRKIDGVWLVGVILWPVMIVDVLTGSIQTAKETVYTLNPACPGS